MIELLGSKAGVCNGKFHYGTAFGEPSNLADKVCTACIAKEGGPCSAERWPSWFALM